MSKNIFIEGLQGTGKSTLLTRLAKALPEYQVYREGDVSPVELAWCSYMTGKQFQETLEKYPQLEEEIRKQTVCEVQSESGNSSVTSAREECNVAARIWGIQTKNAADPLRYITAYTLILAEQREFYEYMEQHEIYNGRVSFEIFHDTIMKRYAAYTGEQSIFECSFFQNSMECMMLYYQMTDDEITEFYSEAFEILASKGFLMLYLDSPDVRGNTLQIKKERCDAQGNEMWYPLMLNYLKESPYGKAHHYQGLEDMIAHFERRRSLELRIIREVLGEVCMILPAKVYMMEDVLVAVRQILGKE